MTRAEARAETRDDARATPRAEDAERFERRVRSMYGDGSGARVKGVCVLDVGVRNILMFEQGRFDLVRRDLVVALGDEEGSRAARFVDSAGAVADAFGIRKNVVNLKKVLLQSQYEIESLDLRLRRLSTFFRSDFDKRTGFRGAARFREIVVAHGRCKGAAKAIFDARMFTKQICCVPRHPDEPRPRRLAAMPSSLISHGYVEKALDRWTGRSPSLRLERAEGTDSPSLTDDFDRLVRRVREEMNVPSHVAHFIELSLIARGAAKAMVMRRELREFLDHVSVIAKDAATVAERLRSSNRGPDEVLRDDLGIGTLTLDGEPSPEVLEKLSHAAKVDADANPLEGAAPVLAELERWLVKILENPKTALFAAGDDEHTSAFVPQGFELRSMIADYAPVVEKYHSAMLDELARDAGTLHPEAADARHISGLNRCQKCEKSFAKIWVSLHTCVSCEESLRASGRCPVKSECEPRFFCPHARACLRCERVSCERCGVVRGDGDDVISLVESLDAECVFLDFDRTICATKAGASPLPKNFRELDFEALARAAERFAADAELVGLLRSHDGCFIVTRNSNVEAIEYYLRARGVSDPKVHRALKGESKASVIERLLTSRLATSGEGRRRASVFADDDVRELVREDVRALENVHCVLFTREKSFASS